MTPAKNARFFD